ncbi:MAG: dihydrolipoyllysine-residue succinyltransferase [Mariprofundaceae bacterium]|nr:dihydrolipoyllysine-residue succinyltransferase [Mariprofundaceae bacterium]
MDIEIKVPSLGESESEATLVSWRKQPGDDVAEDDMLAEIESDKITMEITAFANGVLKEVRKQEGDAVAPGEVIGLIEERVQTEGKKKVQSDPGKPSGEKVQKEDVATEGEIPQPAKKEAVSAKPVKAVKAPEPATVSDTSGTTPVMRGKAEERVPMSRLRKTIAMRLKEAQNTAAILTTFNEVNMQPVMDLRAKYRDAFREKHGANLGFMSFFVKACIEGLKQFPVINACIEDTDIIYRNYYNIGIAVSTDRGLVAPIVRDAGQMSMAGIETAIADYAVKAREGGLLPDDLKGGTFSMTNGGVFGSLLSTPILNPPQSAILGMHAIQKRPVVEGDQVVIRPMMYLALSYDHRIIDGREAVQFLVMVKETLEFPGRMLLDL